MRKAQYAILFLICQGPIPAVAQVPNLKTVLERAEDYVSTYEEQLGSIIGDDDSDFHRVDGAAGIGHELNEFSG